MAKKDTFADIKAMSFEQAMAELESLVRQMEKGQLPLEESITAYERGMALKAHCAVRLSEAKERIDKIVEQHDGSLSLTPLDA